MLKKIKTYELGYPPPAPDQEWTYEYETIIQYENNISVTIDNNEETNKLLYGKVYQLDGDEWREKEKEVWGTSYLAELTTDKKVYKVEKETGDYALFNTNYRIHQLQYVDNDEVDEEEYGENFGWQMRNLPVGTDSYTLRDWNTVGNVPADPSNGDPMKLYEEFKMRVNKVQQGEEEEDYPKIEGQVNFATSPAYQMSFMQIEENRYSVALQGAIMIENETVEQTEDYYFSYYSYEDVYSSVGEETFQEDDRRLTRELYTNPEQSCGVRVLLYGNNPFRFDQVKKYEKQN
jgi:hypothetical protein